ncbi:MAG: peptidase M15 [Bacteroidales bacterium]|jgi:hypothetical protein|nr:peptidase M15 [Bacteroidales bacterium]
MEFISRHISYSEATKSQVASRYGKENIPNEEQLAAMKLVAEKIFEPIREHFKRPIAVTSFFRDKSVNVLAGGSANSQHCKGEALDMDADVLGGLTNAEIFHFIRTRLLFDQLIWEFGSDKNPDWVHASYKQNRNRKQILKNRKNGYKTEYELWIG